MENSIGFSTAYPLNILIAEPYPGFPFLRT